MIPVILILFLPCVACLFWVLLHTMVARRTSTHVILMVLSLVLMTFFFADACYATPGVPYNVLVVTHLITIVTAPCVVPLVWMYMDKLRNKKRFRPAQYVWVLAPVGLLFAGITITAACGNQTVATFLQDIYTKGHPAVAAYKGTLLWHYYIWTTIIFRTVVGVELAAAAIHLIKYVIREKMNFAHLAGFLRSGQPIRVTALQLVNLIIPGLFVLSKIIFAKSYMEAHLWIPMLQAALVFWGYFVFMLCSLYDEKEKITLIQAKHVMLFNYNNMIKGPVVELMIGDLLEDAEEDGLRRLQEKIGETLHMEAMTPKEVSAVKEQLFSAVAGSWDDSLLTRFQSLMVNEQLFLQPSLSLGDVADKLHTNKTYISKLVNNTYNLGFPELLNTLRIDYAEQYLKNHPDAKQTEVAKACGFLSASSFNNIFKKITGVTPKVWLVANDKQNA